METVPSAVIINKFKLYSVNCSKCVVKAKTFGDRLFTSEGSV
jgi:hypothetical protein